MLSGSKNIDRTRFRFLRALCRCKIQHTKRCQHLRTVARLPPGLGERQETQPDRPWDWSPSQPGLDLISTVRRFAFPKWRSWIVEHAAPRTCTGTWLDPLVYGDVVRWNSCGTIFSTEELFAHLSTLLKPSRILLAGRKKLCLQITLKTNSPSPTFPKQRNSKVTCSTRKIRMWPAVCAPRLLRCKPFARRAWNKRVEIFRASQPGEL